MLEYNVIFSDRRSISLSIKNGKLTVRAPRKTPIKTIEKIILKHEKWIISHLKKSREKECRYASLTNEEIDKLKKEAKLYFETKTREFSEITGLKYGRIKMCSSKLYL